MKSRMKLAISLPVLITFIALSLVSPVHAAKRSTSAVKPDMPLNDLLVAGSVDINKFWQQNFASARLRYTIPGIVPYDTPTNTKCGVAVLNNAFYCSASNSIYFDYNFINKVYSQVGDYAALSIIAHEWGHLVQTQLGISNGRYFSIQMELQADCAAGAYTRYAEGAGELEEGDMEEAGAGLFNAGDPQGMPWFAPQAHGKAMQRISAFLDGYNGGVAKCFPR